MKLRKMRLARAWSQEQVAEMTGLSVRTIQRIERGQTASLDSLKALAAVFDVNVCEFQTVQNQETKENTNMDSKLKMDVKDKLNEEEALNVVEYVKELKGFYSHLMNYVVVISLLFVINVFAFPGYIWAVWPALGWGIGVLSHAASVFEWFSWFNADWEKKQIEKRLGRKL